MIGRTPSMVRMARRALASAALVTVAAAPTLVAAASPASAASFPTSHTLNLSFLQDPGQPPDPDVYYAGQGLLLTRNNPDHRIPPSHPLPIHHRIIHHPRMQRLHLRDRKRKAIALLRK